MSAGEVAGIALLACLCGLVIGATAGVVITSQLGRTSRRRTRLNDAYARWLAARLTANRAALSFVAAFRALVANHNESIFFSLRTDEAQRTRAFWCGVMKELDLAEAALITLDTDSPRPGPRSQPHRTRVDSLRQAINGDQTDVDRLTRELQIADRAAIDFVRAAIIRRDAKEADISIWGLIVRISRQFGAIVDRWSDAP